VQRIDVVALEQRQLQLVVDAQGEARQRQRRRGDRVAAGDAAQSSRSSPKKARSVTPCGARWARRNTASGV
jgi:hypothetical protein